MHVWVTCFAAASPQPTPQGPVTFCWFQLFEHVQFIGHSSLSSGHNWINYKTRQPQTLSDPLMKSVKCLHTASMFKESWNQYYLQRPVVSYITPTMNTLWDQVWEVEEVCSTLEYDNWPPFQQQLLWLPSVHIVHDTHPTGMVWWWEGVTINTLGYGIP